MLEHSHRLIIPCAPNQHHSQYSGLRVCESKDTSRYAGKELVLPKAVSFVFLDTSCGWKPGSGRAVDCPVLNTKI